VTYLIRVYLAAILREIDRLRRENQRNLASNAVEAGNLSYDQLLSGNFRQFSIDGTDVIVFLHIQKTAGTTFERYLVRQLQVANFVSPGRQFAIRRLVARRLHNRASVRWARKSASANDQVAGESGCSAGSVPAGVAVCMPTGPNW